MSTTQPTINQNDFVFIQNLVKEKSAIIINDDQAYLVEARLSFLLRKRNIADIATLVRSLQVPNHAELEKDVINVMTTNETSFFRDSYPFDALKTIILPKLITDLQKEKTIQIWCGACSSGQEPYSIAMLIKENFSAQLYDWRVNILATDLSSDILAKAKDGKYTQLEVNRGLPSIMLAKYFTRNGLEWQVNEDIRKMIEFKEFNLIEPWPIMPKIHIIFLRNVMIYFEQDVKKQILNKMYKIMNPNGVLFLGGAETIFNLGVPFEQYQLERCSYYAPKKA